MRNNESKTMTVPRVHAEYIKQWADGAEIEIKTDDGWAPEPYPSWISGFAYRIKPATTLSREAIRLINQLSEAAQSWGWAEDQGTRSASTIAEAAYISAKDKLEAFVFDIEQKLLDQTSNL